MRLASIALALVFTVLSTFWACNPDRPWWRKRELVTDLCYWFIIPLVARYLRIGLLVLGAAVLFRITTAEGLVELALARAGGVWHMGGPERLSRLEMGRSLARVIGADGKNILPTKRPPDRPCDVSLDSSRWREAFPRVPWPAFAEGVARLLAR